MRKPQFDSRCARSAGLCAVALGCVALAACNTSYKLGSRVDPRYGVSASPRVIEPGQPVPKGGGTYRVGKPYVVAGRTYYPAENKRYRHEGIASWYGDDFHGRLTANGEVYDMEGVSAAHPTLPMPSYARVTNLRNGRSLVVRVNDRGPYHGEREIDLSSKAAELLEIRRAGTGRVRVEYVGPASLDGSDDRQLMATLRDGAPAPAPSAVMVAAARPFVPQTPDPVVAHRPIRPERSVDPAEERELPSVVRMSQPRLAARALPQRTFENDEDEADLPSPAAGMRSVPASVGRPPVPAEAPAARPEPRMVWSPGPPPALPASASTYTPTHGGVAVTTGRGLY